MTDERDDLLRTIGQELDVEPSAGFHARVLSRVEADTNWRTPRTWAVPLSAAALTAAAVALAVLQPWHKTLSPVIGEAPAASVTTATSRQDERPSATDLAVPEAEAATSPSASVRPDRDVDVAGTVAQVVETRRGLSVPPSRVPAAAPPARPGPEVLVSPDQAILLRQLLADISAGRGTLPAPNPSLNEPIVIRALQAPTPIVIPELVIEPLPPLPTASGG